MALQKSIALDIGVTLPEAYIRVTDVMLSYGQHRGWITVSTYANHEARTSGKQPVLVEEFRVFDTNGQNRMESKYEISLGHVVSGSGDSFSLDLNGDGESEVILVEGVDFQSVMLEDFVDLTETAKNVVTALNENEVFSNGFVADSSNGNITVTALPNGSYSGAYGNNVKVSGNAIQSIVQTVNGEDHIPSDFEKYFNIEDMNMTDVNVISQAYSLIKSLDKFEGAVEL